MDKLKELLTSILEIIGFEDDRNEFIKEFIENTYFQALSDLIETLPKEEQEGIKKSLSTCKSSEDVSALTKKYFTENQMQDYLKAAVGNSIAQFVDSLKGSLTTEQEEKLLVLFHSIEQSPL